MIDPRAPRAASAARLILLALLSGCATTAGGGDDSPPRLQVTELGDLASVSVCGDVWLAETPSPKHLDIAHRRGIRTVISLLGEDDPRDVRVAESCRELGLAFVPIGASTIPTGRDVDRVFAALDRTGRGPALLYCESGARSAMVFAIYRVVRHGVDLNEALEAARRTGMKPGTSEELVRVQVTRLRS